MNISQIICVTLLASVGLVSNAPVHQAVDYIHFLKWLGANGPWFHDISEPWFPIVNSVESRSEPDTEPETVHHPVVESREIEDASVLTEVVVSSEPVATAKNSETETPVDPSVPMLVEDGRTSRADVTTLDGLSASTDSFQFTESTSDSTPADDTEATVPVEDLRQSESVLTTDASSPGEQVTATTDGEIVRNTINIEMETLPTDQGTTDSTITTDATSIRPNAGEEGLALTTTEEPAFFSIASFFLN